MGPPDVSASLILLDSCRSLTPKAWMPHRDASYPTTVMWGDAPCWEVCINSSTLGPVDVLTSVKCLDIQLFLGTPFDGVCRISYLSRKKTSEDTNFAHTGTMSLFTGFGEPQQYRSMCYSHFGFPTGLQTPAIFRELFNSWALSYH